MKGLFIALMFIMFNANATLTDISPIGKVDLKDAETKTTAVAETTATPETKEVAVAEPNAATEPSAIDGKAIYQQSCFACHGTGVAGAPKLGDTAAWAPRIATGMEALLNTALNGKGAMPPKGGNVSLSQEQIEAAVNYMVENSK